MGFSKIGVGAVPNSTEHNVLQYLARPESQTSRGNKVIGTGFLTQRPHTDVHPAGIVSDLNGSARGWSQAQPVRSWQIASKFRSRFTNKKGCRALPRDWLGYLAVRVSKAVESEAAFPMMA